MVPTMRTVMLDQAVPKSEGIQRLPWTSERFRRRKIYCIELIMHTPCIPVSMLALDLTAGGVMNIHVEDGVLERAQH